MSRKRLALRVVAGLLGGLSIAAWVMDSVKPQWPALRTALLLSLAALLIGLRAWRQPQSKAVQKAEDEIDAFEESSSRANKVTVPSEVILWEIHQHPIALIKRVWWRMTVGVIATVGIALLHTKFTWPVLLALWAPLGIWALYEVLVWRRYLLIVTTERLVLTHGVLSNFVGTMNLAKLTDESLSISGFSRLLAWLRIIDLPYGTITVETAAIDQAVTRVFYIPRAQVVNRRAILPSLERKLDPKADDGD